MKLCVFPKDSIFRRNILRTVEHRDYNMELIQCPDCKSGLRKNEVDFVCQNCKKKFPIKNNIAIIVSDPLSHLKFINQKIKEKENWYRGDQIFSYDKGPYRFHLRKRIEFVKRIINDYLKNDKEKRILDLGCGDGQNLRWLASFSNDLWATDYNFLRLSRAEKNLSVLGIKVKFFLTDIVSLPFEEESFDIVFFNHVIEHLRNDLQSLQNVYKVTKKGGLVIIGTPNEGALAWRLAYKIEPKTKRETDHVNFYTAESFAELSKRTGFKIRHIEHLGWGIPVWSLDMRIRKYKFVDDFFEVFGKKFFKKQATSLYIVLEK